MKRFTLSAEINILAALFTLQFAPFSEKDMSFLNWILKIFYDFFESPIPKEFEAYKAIVDQVVNEENERLRTLGIPVPEQVSDLAYQQVELESGETLVKLFPPAFKIPADYRQFILKKHKKEENGIYINFFGELGGFDQYYNRWGLASALYYGGFKPIWTNRDPYDFYRSIEKTVKRNVTCRKAGDFTNRVKVKDADGAQVYNIQHAAREVLKLEGVPALSIEEAAVVHLRVRLFNLVTGGNNQKLRNFKTYYDASDGAASVVPQDFLFELPVAPLSLSPALVTLKILPAVETRPAQMVEFLNSLRSVNRFLSFELVRVRGGSVFFRLSFPQEAKREIVKNLLLYFPDFVVEDMGSIENSVEFHQRWLLKSSTYKAIRELREYQIDPYAHFAQVFNDEAEDGDDLICYQIVFAPLAEVAAGRIKNYLAGSYWSDFYKSFSNQLPLWMVSVSLSGTNKELLDRFAGRAASTLGSAEESLHFPKLYPSYTNSFPPLVFPFRFGLYQTGELAALAHYPVTKLPIENLETTSMKNVSPPDAYTKGETRIGESRGRLGQRFPVSLPETVRDRHLYIVGKSGTGKSTLMETVARRDIEAGRGVCVIDPHGDLIQHLLETMPDHRVGDCILFSPKISPFSLEILKADNEHEIDLLTDDLITMFRRTSESWGDKMQAILQMAFQTLLRVPGSSFSDINTLLTDESYRRRILDKINHPQLSSFWEHRYDMRQAEPILIRMDRLTTSSTLRQVLTQNKNSLNFYDVISESKIFLADLSKGFLGESTSHLLGSIIVSQVQLAAMRQAHLPAEQRIPFSLFVDEVQNFTTSAFSTILSEARKQKLRLTVAHQFVSQLPQDLQKAVFGNVGTLVFFVMSPDDLGAARHELGTFEAGDVANLPKYHALCRPATAARDTFSFVTDPPPPPRADARKLIQSVIEQTLNEYGAVAASAPAALPVITQADPALQSNDQLSALSKMQSNLPVIDQRRPARAEPLVFSTNADKILHFLRQAEYLSQPQIIALTGLQPSNASTALKKLVDTGQIKSLDDRRPKIYFIGRNCNPTVHNLLVRDLFVKINNSNFAIRSVKFNDQLADLNPDLTIEFIEEGENRVIHTALLCYMEVDRGTEGVSELLKKADRYSKVSPLPRIGFIFERESDLVLARKTIQYPFVYYATLDGFSSLEDEAFYSGSAAASPDTKLPFFGS